MEPNNYKQLSLDLGISEEDLEKIKKSDIDKPIKHPFDNTISLEELKEGLIDKYGFNKYGLLLDTPILASSESVISWDKEKGDIWQEEAININNTYELLDNLDPQTIETVKNNSQAPLRYIINYFYNDPKELPNDKIEIINSLTEFRHPKKYIEDIITHETKIEELKPLEYATIIYYRPYLTIKDSWELLIKPRFKKQFTKEGLIELKKVYDNIKANTGSYLTRTPEEEAIASLETYLQEYYNNPNIKNLKDLETFFKERNTKKREIFKEAYTKLETEALNSIKASPYKTKEGVIEAYFTSVKASMETNNILSSEELFKRDTELLRYYFNKKSDISDLSTLLENIKASYPDYNKMDNEALGKIVKGEAEKLKDLQLDFKELYYIQNLAESKEGSLDQLYFSLINLELNLFNSNFIGNPNFNQTILNKIEAGDTLEAKTNKILEHLLQPQYFYRNNAKAVELEETAKGNIAQYSNNILNGLIDNQVSFKNISKKDLPLYEEIKNKIDQAKENITSLEAQLKEIRFNGDIDQEQDLANQIKEAKATLESLEAERLKNGYVIINNEPFKAKIPASTDKLKISLKETPNSIELVLQDNFIISYPKNFDIKTLVNKKETTINGSLASTDRHDLTLTPDRADQLGAYIRLIIKKASNSYNGAIEFTIEELTKRFNLPQDKNASIQIKYLTALLDNSRIHTINLKGGKKGSITTNSIISSYSVNNGIVRIILSPLISEIAKLNSSKIWTKDTLLTPQEDKIDNKTAQIMNQLEFNKFSGEARTVRNVKAITLIRGVNTFNLDSGANNFSDSVVKPYMKILESLNKNPSTLYNYTGYNALKGASKISDLEERELTVSYKKEEYIPAKIKHKEEHLIELSKKRKK